MKYRVRVNYTNAKGEHKQVERTVYGYEEAKLLYQQLTEKYKNNGAAAPSKMTVSQLINKYEKSHSQDTKKGSHDTAMRTLRLRVEPFLGNKRLDKLTAIDLEDWKTDINQQQQSKGKAKGKCLSLRTKRNAYKALMSLLNYAVRLEYIPKNPLKAVYQFKDVNQDRTKKDLSFYTAEQFALFIEAAEKHCNSVEDWNYYVFFYILFFMGLRKGECYGLTWNDIEGNIMHIRRSVSQKIKDEDGNDYVDSPKNHKNRDILIPQQLITVLNAHKKRQQEAAHDQFNEHFKVCGYGNRSIRDTSVDNRNKLYANEAGLPHIRIHDFRHPYVKPKTKNILKISEIFHIEDHIAV